ncbi:hypothetical protein P885DRAFT_81924 [Corynascus similis CBS 632.67]
MPHVYTKPPPKPPQSSLAPSRNDFHFWRDPPLSDIDIVFIHSLGEDHLSAWTHGKTTWPKDLLGAELPTARIMSYKYQPGAEDFFPVADASDETKERMDRLADDLYKHLVGSVSGTELGRRSQRARKPLYFVAHCLGGLVCANLLARVDDEEGGDRADRVNCHGVIFLGTPFADQDERDFWRSLAKRLGCEASVQMTGSAGPVRVRRTFEASLRRSLRGLHIALFAEEGESEDVIVTDEYVDLTGEALAPFTLESDHFSISRFQSKEDPGFKATPGTAGFLLELDTQRLEKPVNDYINHKLSVFVGQPGYNKQVLDGLSAEFGKLLLNGKGALEAVKKFPSGLASLYGRIIDMIDGGQVGYPHTCKNVLAAVTLAHRPLTLSELAILADLPSDMPRTIVENCGSFLTVKEETVYLIHQSAKDYLYEKYLSKLRSAGVAQRACQRQRAPNHGDVLDPETNIYNLNFGFK